MILPDAFQFGEIFPKIVTQHVLRCSGSRDFHYVLNPTGTYYEECQQCFVDIELPSIPSRKPGPKLPPSDIRLLRDYKIKYFQGVRQNYIRNTNTKNKAGTLPCEAYQTSDPEEINFADMLLGVEDSVTNLEIAIPTEILRKDHMCLYSPLKIVLL